MSLLNKASLIQIPSGYKDGTLYSAKPTNGDGDFTFSRGSNLAATRVNSEGLIEKGRENLLTYSNDLSNAVWTKSQGSVSGSKWIPDTTNNYHTLGRTATIQNGSVYAWSIEVKADGYDFVLLNIASGMGTNSGPIIDLTDGTLAGTYNGYDHNAIIESVEDGYYRIKMWFVSTTTSLQLDTNPFPTSSVATYSGDNTKGILVRRIQLEQGLVATDYIPTTTTTAQAGILEDMPRLDYSGGASCGSLLLEPQRSNLLTQSEYFGAYSVNNGTATANQIISPEGILNAYQFTENTGTSAHYIDTTSISVTSGNSYVISLFAKYDGRFLTIQGSSSIISSNYATFNLQTGVVEQENIGDASIEDYGSGWYRCIFKITATGTGSGAITILLNDSATGGRSRSYTGDGTSGVYLYGFQVESGSYSTSLIPTYGASVTRGGDDTLATHTISDTETLTYYTEFIAPEQTGGGGEHLLENSSGSSRIRVYQNNSTSIRIRTDSPSANFDYTYSSLGIDVGDTVKIALSVDSGVMTAFINGVKKNTFSSATINFARLHLRPQTIITYNTGIIFDSALSDDECIALTTI